MQRGLESCSEDLCDVIRIGRVLGTRWCASSRRAHQAIWQNYPALAKHFADNLNKPTFSGLPKIFTSSTFFNVALILDSFSEVSELSRALQSESNTLSQAYKLVRRCIRALIQFKEGHNGENTKTAEESCATGFHRQIVLTSYSKLKTIHHDRCYQSLIDNLDARLSANPELRQFLDQIDVPSKWPTAVESPWLEGEAKIKKLCDCFSMNGAAVKRAFRDYVDDPP